MTGLALLGAAALPAAAAATTASVEGEVIRIVDTEGIDDHIVISAGGGDTEGVAWEIDGADGVGELCQGTGEATCTDGRYREFDAPTRRFEIDLGEGDDEIEYVVASEHAGDGAGGKDPPRRRARTSWRARGLEAHSVDAGPGDDTIEVRGFAPGRRRASVLGTRPGGRDPRGRARPRHLRPGSPQQRRHGAGRPGPGRRELRRSQPAVSVTLDGAADDGSGEEGDDVQPDVEELIGTSAADALTGAGGDQVIDGGRGADALDGRGGADTLSFASRATAVDADLAAGTTTDGDAIDGFEHLRGGRGDDRLTGDGQANEIEGGDGEDTCAAGPAPTA